MTWQGAEHVFDAKIDFAPPFYSPAFPTFVHKLIRRGTVEERIRQMQDSKGDLATDLLSGATRTLSLTPETLEGLLGPIG